MADTTTQSWKLHYEAGRQALLARKVQEAEQCFSAALQLAEDFAAGDPRLAATLNALARVYSLQRRYLAAAALLNRLLEVTERTMGPGNAQVAGVLTNLAEMYTHLGAVREELELRERVLAIRRDDGEADPAALARLRERVDELRAVIEAEEAATSAQDEPDDAEPSRAPDPLGERTPPRVEKAPQRTAAPRPVRVEERAPSKRLSSGLLVAYHASESNLVVSGGALVDQPGLSLVRADESGTTLAVGYPAPARFASLRRRRTLYSAAAGAVLVAGLVAARGFGDSNGGRVSGGAVSIANSTIAPPPAVVIPPPLPRPSVAPQEEEAGPPQPEPVEERSERRTERAPERSSEPRVPRAPSKTDLDRALRAVDGAVRIVGQHTRDAADSATSVRIDGPVFKKTRIADP